MNIILSLHSWENIQILQWKKIGSFTCCNNVNYTLTVAEIAVMSLKLRIATKVSKNSKNLSIY